MILLTILKRMRLNDSIPNVVFKIRLIKQQNIKMLSKFYKEGLNLRSADLFNVFWMLGLDTCTISLGLTYNLRIVILIYSKLLVFA